MESQWQLILWLSRQFVNPFCLPSHSFCRPGVHLVKAAAQIRTQMSYTKHFSFHLSPNVWACLT